jgi:hypothetical protein
MSSHAPNQDTFDSVRTFLEKQFGKEPIQGFCPLGDVDVFIEQLANLAECSVHEQHNQNAKFNDEDYPKHIEIFTDEWSPKDLPITSRQCLKNLEYICYQIEKPNAKGGVYIEAYVKLQTAKFEVLKMIANLKHDKDYEKTKWGF